MGWRVPASQYGLQKDENVSDDGGRKQNRNGRYYSIIGERRNGGGSIGIRSSVVNIEYVVALSRFSINEKRSRGVKKTTIAALFRLPADVVNGEESGKMRHLAPFATSLRHQLLLCNPTTGGELGAVLGSLPAGVHARGGAFLLAGDVAAADQRWHNRWWRNRR